MFEIGSLTRGGCGDKLKQVQTFIIPLNTVSLSFPISHPRFAGITCIHALFFSKADKVPISPTISCFSGYGAYYRSTCKPVRVRLRVGGIIVFWVPLQGINSCINDCSDLLDPFAVR
jgi:hypothetical protein